MRVQTMLLVACFALLASCSKDEDPVDTTDYSAGFYGRWQVTSGGDDIKYMQFEAERIWYILGEDAHGFRGVATGTYLADASVINFGGRLFLYSRTTDQLALLNSSDTINLVRNPNAPSHSQWLRQASVTDSIPAPANLGADIGTDSTTLWFGSGLSGSPVLYKINIAARTVDSLSTQVVVIATEWDGTNLWTSGPFSNQLSKIDPATGSVLSSSVAIGSNLSGLAWNGEHLWAGSQSSRSLSVYDPRINAVIQTYPEVFGDGMAFAEGFLYICKDGAVHRCTTVPLRALNSYSIPTGRAAGIAHDGTGFWVTVATGPGPQYLYKIYRVVL